MKDGCSIQTVVKENPRLGKDRRVEHVYNGKIAAEKDIKATRTSIPSIERSCRR